MQQQQQGGAHPSFPQYGNVNVGGQQIPQQQQWQQQQWGQPVQQQVTASGEPNYGPAPPIPGVWRG